MSAMSKKSRKSGWRPLKRGPSIDEKTESEDFNSRIPSSLMGEQSVADQMSTTTRSPSLFIWPLKIRLMIYQSVSVSEDSEPENEIVRQDQISRPLCEKVGVIRLY